MGKERVNFFWSLITTGYKKLFIEKSRRYYMLPVVIIIFISVCSIFVVIHSPFLLFSALNMH